MTRLVRRLSVLALVGLLWAQSAAAAITLGTPITAGSTGGANITTVAADTSGTQSFVVFVSSYVPPGTITLTDASTGCASPCNTWTARTSFAGVDARISAFYCATPTVGAGHTFTASSSGTAYPSIVVIPITAGANTASFFDKDAGKTTNGTAISLDASVTPTNANALAISALAFEVAGSPTVNESYGAPTYVTFSSGNHLGIAVATWIQTTITATQPTWTASSGDMAHTVTIFNASVGGASSPCTRSLLGVGCHE